MTVSLSQTYYSDERASQVDPSYGDELPGPGAANPVSLAARSAGSRRATQWDAGTRIEYDQYTGDLLTIGASAAVRVS